MAIPETSGVALAVRREGNLVPRSARRFVRVLVTLISLVPTTVACGGSTAPTPLRDGGAGSGGASTGGSAGAGGGAGTGAAAGTGGVGGGGGACNPRCGTARECCVDHCVNLQNDLLNCGTCGKKCGSGTYCTGGQCVTPPCQTTCGAGATCCGSACCKTGELCCDPQGPLDRGPACETPTNGTCPMGCAPLCVCASPDTPIATPEGDRPIFTLKTGDFVYSVDHGTIIAVPIVQTNRTPVSRHSVMRVVLRGGSVLEISPLHPTADGRTFGGLVAGDSLDGVSVVSAGLVPYTHEATYDILPDSDTGTYFAGGVLIGSTLVRRAGLVVKPTTPVSSPRESLGLSR